MLISFHSYYGNQTSNKLQVSHRGFHGNRISNSALTDEYLECLVVLFEVGMEEFGKESRTTHRLHQLL